MMEKKYQLAAWTENVVEPEKARLYMIPSLESEVQASFVHELACIHKEEYKCHGRISIGLARRAIRAYENMSRFEYLTGHIGDSIRYLFFAARYCIYEDDMNWAYYGTDLGHYSYFCGKLRHEFVYFCEKAISLARKHGFEYILEEKKPKETLELYWEHTQEEQDLKKHLKEVSAWK